MSHVQRSHLIAGIPRVVYGTTESQFLQFIPIEQPAKNPLTFREIMTRSNPAVQVLGPLMEKEGLVLHAWEMTLPNF